MCDYTTDDVENVKDKCGRIAPIAHLTAYNEGEIKSLRPDLTKLCTRFT